MPRRIPAATISCVLLLTAAILLVSCGSETAIGGSATNQVVTTQTVTTEIAQECTTATTTVDTMVMTTSLAVGLAVSEGTDAVQQLGDAVISYLSGRGDLAALQQLVAPSAQDGLALMLSLLSQPTRCKVMRMAAYGSSNEIEVELLFAGGTSEPADFTVTIVVDLDERTITTTAIRPGRSVDPYAPITTTVSTTVTTTLDGIAANSSLPVIQVQAEPKLDYLNPDYAYYTAEAVALVTVVEVLPFRRNPLAGTAGPDGPNEHQPIVFKGYVLRVERAYGPDTIPKRITVYALGNGIVLLDGVTYQVRDEFPLDVNPGDRLFVPLMKVAYFGTPELEQDEYWVQANWAAFAVDDSGNCTRVTGADVDPENLSDFTLSDLENASIEQGKRPSLVD